MNTHFSSSLRSNLSALTLVALLGAMLPLNARAVDMTAYASLTQMETLSEVMRHLYRWYLDEADFDAMATQKELVFEIKAVTPTLDKGDRSLYADITIPIVSASVRMKKTDYRIDELGVHVQSGAFKIINVEKLDAATPRPAPDQPVKIPTKDMMAYLFKTRSQPDFPSPELSKRLGGALRKQIEAQQEKAEGEQTIFVAPLSPVANEIWAYWVDIGLLMRWSSDIQLSNPAVWEHESLALEVYDIEQQVVLAFSEAPGSNAYLTRDQVGRIIYNCTVVGEMRRVSFSDDPKPNQE